MILLQTIASLSFSPVDRDHFLVTDQSDSNETHRRTDKKKGPGTTKKSEKGLSFGHFYIALCRIAF